MNMVTRRKEINTMPTRQEHALKIDEIREDIEVLMTKVEDHTNKLKWYGVQSKFLDDIKAVMISRIDGSIAFFHRSAQGKAITRVNNKEWKEEAE